MRCRAGLVLTLVLAVVQCLAVVDAPAQADAVSPQLSKRATAFIELLKAQQYERAVTEFDETMRRVMPAEKLRNTWQGVVQQHGELSEYGDVLVSQAGEYRVVDVACTFEKSRLDLRISFDKQDKIAGLFFLAPRQAAKSSSDTPAADEEHAANSVELQTTAGTLSGTLDLPAGDGPWPAVVVIAGSGPTDRDGNQPTLKNDSLKLLGRGLAQHGIVVLRYDKRAIGRSTMAGLKEEDLRFDMYADDAAAWVEWLARDPRFTQIGIVGHSEGSLLGMLAARKSAAKALVSIAGAGRSAPELLREQLSKNLPTDKLKQQSNEIVAELVAGRLVADVPAVLVTLFRPSVQPYLISWFQYDPAKELARLKIPVLIVQGTTDVQVSLPDAERLAAAKPEAKLETIEGMNHVLKSAQTQAEQLKAYTDPSLPLSPELVGAISAFLKDALK